MTISGSLPAPTAPSGFPSRDEVAEVADEYLSSRGDSLWPEARRAGGAALISGLAGIALGAVFPDAALFGVLPGLLIGTAGAPRTDPMISVLLSGSCAATCAGAARFAAGNLPAALAVAAGGALLVAGLAWTFGDVRYSQAERRFQEFDQRVGESLTLLRMADASGGSGGVDERGDRVSFGGILVRKKKP
ncbi:MAG: hypothetical protein AB1758_24565 [Candidatus Eremiobacterota bacterium]